MNRHFNYISEYSSHIYIADYTQQTQSVGGVEISDTPFDDIKYCTVSNPKNIECWGVNFEKNPNVFKLEDANNPVSQCECMIVSKNNAKEKGWVCLMELKYCLEKNIKKNSKGAFNQLVSTFDYLKGKGIIELKIHRVYFNISIPDHSNKQPFNSFSFSQDKIIDLKRTKSIHFLGFNEIKVLDEGYLVKA
jgi:hypothetical protein